MNYRASISMGPYRHVPQLPKKRVAVLVGLVLSLTGCGSFRPELKLPDINIKPNSPAFENRFYAGLGFGSTRISPDTSDAPAFSADSSNSGSSQIKFGYDWHNQLALELESSILGEADVDQSTTASIKYSSLSTSALFYATKRSDNRNRRQGFNGYGRLGVGVHRTASNIAPLDGSETGLLIGAGAEYGMKNGIGIRGEVTQFGSDATYLGLGVVFRFNSIKRFLPENPLITAENTQVRSRFEETKDANPSVIARRSFDPDEAVEEVESLAGVGSASSTVGAVKVLASARDHDVDGVANEVDKCPETAAGTAVGNDGCGLFDGTLANGVFSNGSAGLNSNVKASLDNLAARLRAFPEVRLAIEGHTDSKGPEDINMNVSRARAHMVRDYLLRQGISPQQLETHAYGETRPVADNSTERGRDQNRRIELLTLPSLSRTEIAFPVVPTLSNTKNEKSKLSQKKNQTGKQDKAFDVSDYFDGQRKEPLMAAAKRSIDWLPATVPLPGLDLHRVMEGVEFVEKSATLKPESAELLSSVADVLKRHSHIQVMLAAHTNELETEEKNRLLSIKQAESVAAELVKLGVDQEQLVIEGFGNSLPIVQEVSDADRATNRRVELRPVRD